MILKEVLSYYLSKGNFYLPTHSLPLKTMVKNNLLFIFLIFTAPAFCQDQLKSSDISKFAHTFNITNNQLVGQGADLLMDKLSASQFVLLGEQHFSPEISELTNALLPKLRGADFGYFAVEVGPYSAQKMVSMINTEQSLFDFNTSFHSKYNDIPIPFFDGKKDEQFLKTAIREQFKIWGIDQEFYSSQLFLIDELYKLSPNKSSVTPHYIQSKQFLETEFKKDATTKGHHMFTNLLNSETLKSFFNKCGTEKQQSMISELVSSWEIYALNEVKKYKKNNFTRMQYMKRKFGEYYKTASKTTSLPKVFVKMGSMHLARGKNWLGIYDLGNLTKELSYFNGTKSTSINCFARYWKGEDGKVYDYLDEEDGKVFQPILELARKDKWVLIETKPILQLAKKEKMKLPSDLQILISGFDFILFSPTKTEVQPNYSK